MPYGNAPERTLRIAFVLAGLLAGGPHAHAQDLVELPGAGERRSAHERGVERSARFSTALPTDESPQELILSFRYGDVVTADVSARYVGNDIYVPIGGLFSLLGIAWEIDWSVPAITGFYLEEDRTYALDFAAGEARLGEMRQPLTNGDVLVLDHDVFVRPHVLEDVFDVPVLVDLAALSVHVRSDRLLPVALRSRRARERPLAIDPYAAFRHAPLTSDRSRRILGGGVTDYNVSIHRSGDQTRLNLQSALGAEVLGGDLAWQGRAGIGGGPFVAHETVRWRYVMDEGEALRQLRVGTLHSDGLRPASYRGVHLTNRPARPERLFGEDVVRGQVEPDWELELYVDERLVDVTRAPASGLYRFDVPITYGTSRLQVRAYGPAGEVRDLRQRIRIPFSMVRPGRVRYNVHGGANRTGLIGQADAGYGITRHLTAGLGVDYAETYRPMVYASVTSRLFRHYLASMDLSASGVQRFSLNGLFPSQGSVDLRYVRTDPTDRAVLTGHRSQASASGFLPVHVGRYPMSIRLSGTRMRYGSKEQYRVRSHLQAAIDGVQFYLTAESDFSQAFRSIRLIPSLSYVWSQPPAPWRPFRGLMVSARARVDAGAGRMNGIELNAAHSISRTTRVQLFTDLGMSRRPTSVGFRISTVMPYVRSITDTRAQPSSPSIMQTFRGSVALDRHNGRILFSDRPAVGRSAAALRLFVDRNANGMLDAGEHVLDQHAIHLDRGSALSSGHRAGVTHVGDLLPYERYTARIEEGAITNPLWVPHRSAFSFIADPNSVKAIDVPLYAAGVVEGAVIDRRTGEPFRVGGLLVRIVDLNDGSERVLQTFSDGSFYEMGFRPGTYEARLDRSQLGARDLSVETRAQRFVVQATSNGDYVDHLQFFVAERRDAPRPATPVLRWIAPPTPGPSVIPAAYPSHVLGARRACSAWRGIGVGGDGISDRFLIEDTRQKTR